MRLSSVLAHETESYTQKENTEHSFDLNLASFTFNSSASRINDKPEGVTGMSIFKLRLKFTKSFQELYCYSQRTPECAWS